MTPELHRRSCELFSRLHGLSGSELEEALDTACAGDVELRAQVRKLIEGDRKARHGFLKNSAMEDAARLLAPGMPALPATGTVIGNFRLAAQIGAGGMGVVYEAEDLHLHRRVAVKILPVAFGAQSADRIQRFQREARAASLLNHPNIVSIFDADFDRGYYFIAMEFVEGTTLRQLSAGAQPPDSKSILDLTDQIASALGAAHEAGIVHRDIKPENIMVRPDGLVKVLDFGLAKLREPASGAADLRTRPENMAGTVQYLSPEQVLGKPVGPRSDLFSLGVVSYELATGVRPFDGPTDGAVFDAIVNLTPPAPSTVRPGLGHELDSLIMRALEKDPDLRFQTANDIKSASRLTARDLKAVVVRVPAGRKKSAIPWAVAAIFGVLSLALAIMLWRALAPREQPFMRFSVDLGPEALSGLRIVSIISPDGKRLVYIAKGEAGKRQLATRRLDQQQAALLAGTDGAADPFFSPDSQWIGFFADAKMKKISVLGGPAATVCDAEDARGASWGEDGNIVFTTRQGRGVGLSRVPAAGGTPATLTTPAAGEVSHRWPQILPGGRAVLFTSTAIAGDYENGFIEVLSLATGHWSVVERGGYFGRYFAAPNGAGYLFYLHQSTLFAAPFRLDRMAVSGAPVPLVEDVAGSVNYGSGQFDISRTGTLVYAGGKDYWADSTLALLDRSGRTQALLRNGNYSGSRFSPDGRQLALQVAGDIEIYDRQHDRLTRLTSDRRNSHPVWTPDGKHIVFRSTSPAGQYFIQWIAMDGSGPPQILLESRNEIRPFSFSPDGKRLAFVELGPDANSDIWTLPIEGAHAGQPELFLGTPAWESSPGFSPDGKWMAYTSNESGRTEVYVRAAGGKGARGWQISIGGGSVPVWSREGRHLLFEGLDYRIMVADLVLHGDSVEAGKPRAWSDRKILPQTGSQQDFDLAPDGQSVIALMGPESGGEPGRSVHLMVLLNFVDQLRRLVPR